MSVATIPHQEKPLLTANRDQHRKIQLDTMQRSADHGNSGPSGHS